MSDDHREIWLECACGEFSYEGRQWCQDNVFDCSDHDEGCKGPVRYVRADRIEELERQLAEARNAALEEAAEAVLACETVWHAIRAIDALKDKPNG